MTATSVRPAQGGARVGIQKFGSFLSSMVMPNIPAFIAWGFITALFIETGWTPVGVLGGFGEDAAGNPNPGLVGPIITYLLPLLIAYTGGRNVHGLRGGVVGATVTMGVIMGAAGTPMFLGALICGPLAAWILKQIDKLYDGKIRPGFEMLVNNYTAGIAAFAMTMAAFFGLAPLLKIVSDALGNAVEFLLNAGLLPLMSIVVEPAKVLFLNNAINHGVLTPLGADQVADQGKSLLFLVEANPGPGLGLLLAFTFFGVGVARATAPGAIIIQFLGGIHEIYFPYVLMKPALLLAVIAGGATGVATNAVFNSGLVAPASPGSIFAVLLSTEKGSYLGVILSVILSAAVSFVVAAVILRASRKRDLESENAGDLGAAIAATQANKGKDSSVLSGLGTAATGAATSTGAPAEYTETGSSASGSATATATRPVRNIVFACDAGMGSSAMGASVLRNKIKKAGIEGVTVVNKAIANLDDSADLVITQRELTARAEQKAPSAQHVSVDNFMNSPRYDEVVNQVATQNK